MTPRRRRMVFAALALAGVAVAAALAVQALRSNMSYFFTPEQVVRGESPDAGTFRLGGLVKEGSLRRREGDIQVGFVVTMNQSEVEVSYEGILPDLFAEGQGVVAKGVMGPDGVFRAEEVLAKHDEEYMPPEVADAMEKSGIEYSNPVPGAKP